MLNKSFFEEFERDFLELQVPPELSAMEALNNTTLRLREASSSKRIDR
jgi:hypothetical protein